MKTNNIWKAASFILLLLTLQAYPNTNETATAELLPEEPAATNSVFNFELSDVADNLVIIESTTGHEKNMTCGFVAMMDGKPYLVTRQTFLLGTDRLNFSSFGERELKPRSIELSSNRNLVRLALTEGSGFAMDFNVSMNDPVGICGATVATNETDFLQGSVNGLGADIFEISAEFNDSHLGCPILTPEQKVIGIASYSRNSSSHIMKKGTRFEDRTRRFCRRLNNSEWRKISWKRFNQTVGKAYRKHEDFIDGVVVILNSWSEGPLDQVQFTEQPGNALAGWLESHNTIVSHPVGTGSHRRNFYINYSDSSKKLADLCRIRAKELNKLSEQRGLTEFMRNELETQAGTLDYFAQIILRYGSSTYND